MVGAVEADGVQGEELLLVRRERCGGGERGGQGAEHAVTRAP
jgi:hypothetical protein